MSCSPERFVRTLHGLEVAEFGASWSPEIWQSEHPVDATEPQRSDEDDSIEFLAWLTGELEDGRLHSVGP